jgi:hypothetical protein
MLVLQQISPTYFRGNLVRNWPNPEAPTAEAGKSGTRQNESG